MVTALDQDIASEVRVRVLERRGTMRSRGRTGLGLGPRQEPDVLHLHRVIGRDASV